MKSSLRGNRRSKSQNAKRRNRKLAVEQLEMRALLTVLGGTGSSSGRQYLGLPPHGTTPTSPGGGLPLGEPPYPIAQTFQLSSRPSATKTIYLDFNGHVTTSSTWNFDLDVPVINTPNFDVDGAPWNFNLYEHELMQRIWQRVSEDYAPFDVNVTTLEPSPGDLVRTGFADNRWGIRVAIGGSWDQVLPDLGPAGGWAYLGSFGDVFAQPAFVFPGSLGFDEKSIALAVSHEVGHTLGLSHDGTTALGYYDGHGYGPTSWGPIMGAPFDREVTHWSRGDYADADNREDDLAIITNPVTNGFGPGNGFGYRPDDHGNTIATATFVQVNSAGVGAAKGVIERNTDEDWFQIFLPDGITRISSTGADRGGNLDMQLELYDAAGRLVAADNPFDYLHASITSTLIQGTYYVRLYGTGRPPTGNHPGYPDYGSLGEYTIHFLTQPTARIQGNVYIDMAADGARQAADPGAAGFVVFIDDNLNGVRDVGESFTISDANGFYDLLTLPGTRHVRVQLPHGYVATDPRRGYKTVSIVESRQIVTGVELGIWGQPGEIQGRKWLDINSNGVVNPEQGDRPLSGMYVYVDLNRDGRPSVGEPSAVTDANGHFVIRNVPIGNHLLRQVAKPGLAPAVPVGGVHAFSMTPAGVVTGLDFFDSPAYDYGDAPDSYMTLRGSGGPVHGYLAGYHLGASIDVEPNGQPGPWATGDDNNGINDDDGVRFHGPFTPGGTGAVDVTVRVPAGEQNGYLHAWFDFNGNGVFDAGEKFINGVRLGNGTHRFEVRVPSNARLGPTYARFRYGPEASLGPGGASLAGEVEDYRISIFGPTPVAANDTFSVQEGSQNNLLNVLANDLRSALGPISIVATPFQGTGLATQLGGRVTINNGHLIYRAAPAPASSEGQRTYVDRFQYSITDGTTTATATVSITVEKISRAPVPVDDITEAVFATNYSAVIDVLRNDVRGTNRGIPYAGVELVTFQTVVRDRAGNAIGTVTRDDNGTTNIRTDDRLVFRAANGVTNATGQFTYTINNPGNADASFQRTGVVTVQVRPQALRPAATDRVKLSTQLFSVASNGGRGARLDSEADAANLIENREYWLGVYAQDLRNVPDNVKGVVSVYLDLLYDPNFLQVVRDSSNRLGMAIDFGPNYQASTAQVGSIATPGIINEIGVLSTSSIAGGQEHPVFFIKFRVKDVPDAQLPRFRGLQLWRTDPADRRSDVSAQFSNDIQVRNPTNPFQRDRVLIQDVAYLRSNNFKIQPGSSSVPNSGTGANTAPRLNTNLTRTLTAIKEDDRNSWGTPVWTLLDGVSDPDPGAVKGMAVTAANSTHGQWQYTLNGGTNWLPIGGVSLSQARLLPANGNQSRIRFVPNQDYNGTQTLGFFAWDRTQGVSGQLANLEGPGKLGGSTAFSAQFGTATLRVIPVNDAPVVRLGVGPGYTLNAAPVVIAGAATVRDVDSPNFNGGWLRSRVIAGADAGDRITVGGLFRNVNGSLVFNDTIVMGQVQSAGAGSTALIIKFNQNATLARVEQLVRSLRFSTVNSTKAGQRTVEVQVSDGIDVSNIATSPVWVK
jgi:hypothetical protein